MNHPRLNRALSARRRGNWLLGCGIVLAVVVLLLIGGGVYVAMNLRTWSANAMSTGINKMLAESPIDDAEKAETQAVVDGFIQDFRDKKVSYEQVGAVFAGIMEGPILPAGIALGVGHAYFEESTLTSEEKEEGKVQVARIAHGLADKSLEPSVLRDVLSPLRADPGDSEAIQFELEGTNVRVKAPENATDEDLRAFVLKARETADTAGLPPAPPPFDLSGELQKVIDQAKNPTAGDAPEPVPAVDPEPTGEADTPAEDPAP